MVVPTAAPSEQGTTIAERLRARVRYMSGLSFSSNLYSSVVRVSTKGKVWQFQQLSLVRRHSKFVKCSRRSYNIVRKWFCTICLCCPSSQISNYSLRTKRQRYAGCGFSTGNQEFLERDLVSNMFRSTTLGSVAVGAEQTIYGSRL